MKVYSHGEWRATKQWLKKAGDFNPRDVLNRAGQRGVEALRAATPVQSGATAAGWYYEINRSRSRTQINWCNSHVNEGVNIAVILQYGHGMPQGGYISGRDYINPAIQPIFDSIAEQVWKELTGNGHS